MYTLSPCINTSMHYLMRASFFSFPLLDTYCMSIPSFGYKILCKVINFLVLWFICLNSFLIHFKNGPDYLTRKTAQVFIPSMRFLLQSWVSKSSLVLEVLFSYFFSFILVCLMVSASKIPQYLEFSFSLIILILSFYSFCCSHFS